MSYYIEVDHNDDNRILCTTTDGASKRSLNIELIEISLEMVEPIERCLLQYTDVCYVDGDVLYGQPLPFLSDFKSSSITNVDSLTEDWLRVMYIPLTKRKFRLNSVNLDMLNSCILMDRDFCYVQGPNVYTIDKSQTRDVLDFIITERENIALSKISCIKAIENAENFDQLNEAVDSLKKRFSKHGY